MADKPSDKDQTTNQPAPEVLKPRSETASAEPEPSASTPAVDDKASKRPRHHTYNPSHKATFIGLSVVVLVLAINAGVIFFVIKSQSKANSKTNQPDVAISASALDKIGVNRSSVGDLGVELIVNPNARFNGQLNVAKDVSIGGQLKLNSKFIANDANLTQLEAGNTALQSLNVNGDATVSSLTLRKDLTVPGTSRLQGPTIASQLFTINNNLDVSGSVAVGGSLSVGNFHTSSLTVDSTLTIGGHIITAGNAPSVAAGSSAVLSPTGNVSISGNDQAGTVGVNIGVGSSSGGMVASVAFRSPYGTTPHVVVTPIGNVGTFYISRYSGGFNIYVGAALSPGGYAFDYIVEQ